MIKRHQNEGFTPNFIIHANDLLCYNKYIEAGIGIGVGRNASHELQSSNLRCLDVVDFVERQTSYVFHKNHASRKTLNDFIRFLKSKAQ